MWCGECSSHTEPCTHYGLCSTCPSIKHCTEQSWRVLIQPHKQEPHPARGWGFLAHCAHHCPLLLQGIHWVPLSRFHGWGKQCMEEPGWRNHGTEEPRMGAQFLVGESKAYKSPTMPGFACSGAAP